MANKSKCTPENILLIAKLVREGATLKHAARKCGIGYTTARNWLKLGRQKGKRYEAYRAFLTGFTVAQSDYLSSLEMKAAKVAVTTRDCLAILALRDPWTWGWERIERAIEKCAEKMVDRILSERSGGTSKAATSSDSSDSK